MAYGEYSPLDIPQMLMREIAGMCEGVLDHKPELLPRREYSVCHIRAGGLVAFHNDPAGMFAAIAIFASGNEVIPMLHIATCYTCRQHDPIQGYLADLSISYTRLPGFQFAFASRVERRAAQLLADQQCKCGPVWIEVDQMASTKQVGLCAY